MREVILSLPQETIWGSYLQPVKLVSRLKLIALSFLMLLQVPPWNQYHGRKCDVRRLAGLKGASVQNQRDYDTEL